MPAAQDRRSLPLLALAAASCAAAALAGLPFLTLAPNRLVPGAPAAAGWAGIAAPLGFLAAGLLWRRHAALALAAALAGLAVLSVGVGLGTAALVAGQPAAARASLGAGAWIAGLALGVVAARAAAFLHAAGALALVASGLALAAAVRLGLFDSLSLVVEYRARAGTVNTAILDHLALAGGALALAAVASVPLALLHLRRGFAARLIDAALNGIQVVPALALFAALVSLLSGLLALLPGLRVIGLGAIGPTPAVIGTAAYLALPLVRSLAAGLSAADPTVVETARALGLTPAQVLLRVRLPLGAPILLGGVRVGAVQSIGLVTLGGLVGAGGLGAVVFDGMAQFAPDLIVLGAAPVIALSLAADRGLAALGSRAGGAA
ncbi:ABC transporter permease [Methylobacterium sp. ID0610]|uniref:ABC transporter permease n=1 Tax=Methylobacterium carpenticola TaxID=3344827 RepID=UPI0036C7103F